MSNNDTHYICAQYKIKSYTINPDRSIDVNGNVFLYDRKLKELPLIFNKVSGFFDISHNNLTSLKGTPKYVGGSFNMSYNKLLSLEDAPEYIGIDISTFGNPIHYIYKNYIKSPDNIELFNELKIIDGNNINIKRLNNYINANNHNPIVDVSLLVRVGYKLI